MNIVTLIVLLSVSASFYFAAGDRDVEYGDVEIKVKGKSGKISFVTKATNTTKKTSVTFEMDSLRELNADGKVVGKTGSPSVKHSFNTFATQDFTFTSTKNKTYQNLSAMGFDFETQILTAKLVISVTILKENGTIENDEEEMQVAKGSLKIDIAVRNWTYCNPCKKGQEDEIGTSLELAIVVKQGGKSTAKKTERKSNRNAAKKSADVYDLGDNTTMILSRKYKAGDEWMEMIDDYPKVNTVGPKQTILFRFDNSSANIHYDPLIQSDSGGNGDDGNGDGGNGDGGNGDGGNGDGGNGGNGDDSGGNMLSGEVLKISMVVFFQIFVFYSCLFN